MDQRSATRKVGCGSVVDPEREIVEDRAVRAIVAMAGGDQLSKRVRHRLHFGNARLKIVDMRFCNAFDLAAWAAAIAPESQEFADFRNRKAEPPRPSDELSSWMSRSP